MPCPLLYEINTRCWLRELSDRNGGPITLGSVPDSEFARWRELGFTHVWLMGVWSTGPRGTAVALAAEDLQLSAGEHSSTIGNNAVAGSPYAIAAYQVPPAFGGETGLRSFRQKLHRQGMKLILDFVPNHVGLDHRWLSERPELIVQSPAEVTGTFAQETRHGIRWLAHGRDPNFLPWTDTAQLDYRQPATRTAMASELQSIADRCDGVRCDMAMLLLNDVFARTWAKFPPLPNPLPRSAAEREPEFWRDAISAIKRAHPEFLFLAEAYWGLEADLQSLGFDYTYDKELYDQIIRRNPRGVQDHLLKSGPRFIEASAHFLENHDEPRIASLLAYAEHRAAAALILALPGMRLLHEGQLTGARVKTPVQFCRRPAEDSQPAIEQWYDQLLAVLPKSAVGKGRGTVLKPREAWPGNPTAQNVILIQWHLELPEFDLVAINLAPHRSQCYAPISVPGLADHNWQMRDWLGPEVYERSGPDLLTQGVYLDLPEHGAPLFHFQPIA